MSCAVGIGNDHNAVTGLTGMRMPWIKCYIRVETEFGFQLTTCVSVLVISTLEVPVYPRFMLHL